jgi:hypothetical protein
MHQAPIRNTSEPYSSSGLVGMAVCYINTAEALVQRYRKTGDFPGEGQIRI